MKNKLVWAICVCLLFSCGCQKSPDQMKAGFDALANREYEEALDCFLKAEEAGDFSRKIYRGKGLAYMGLTQYEEAIDSLQQALYNSPAWIDDFDYDTNYYMAVAYAKSGDPESAIKIYDGILDLHKKDKDAYYLRGYLKAQTQDLDGALKDFKKSLELSKKDVNLYLDIFEALKSFGYEEDGKLLLEQLLLEKEKSLSNFELARIHYDLGNYQEAKDYLDKKMDRENADQLLLLGQIHEKLGDFNYAISLYTQFLNSHQDNAKVYNQLGLCRLDAGESEAALEAFEKALEVEDSTMTQNLQFNKIVAYEHMGDFTTAASLMGQYLKEYPDDSAAVREYQFLETR